ncbi:hypothetical protein ESCO47_00130 [Escherichia phage vB_EcoM_ESCO47]|nr:hypothetical protein ESCO47_00130 [Escherichia phage vB_EcoM_ESCO47]
MLKLPLLIAAIKGHKKKTILAAVVIGGIISWNFGIAPLLVANGIIVPSVPLDTVVDIAFALVGLV